RLPAVSIRHHPRLRGTRDQTEEAPDVSHTSPSLVEQLLFRDRLKDSKGDPNATTSTSRPGAARTATSFLDDVAATTIIPDPAHSRRDARSARENTRGGLSHERRTNWNLPGSAPAARCRSGSGSGGIGAE